MHNLFTLLGIWLILYVGITGTGHLFYNAIFLFTHKERYPRHIVVFWTGFSLLIAILQFLHIFVSLGTDAALSLFGFSLTGYFLNGRRYLKIIYPFHSKKLSSENVIGTANRMAIPLDLVLIAVTVILIAYAVLFTAAASLERPVTLYDTSLYHWQTVTWLQNYHIVPGLANLHFRLGYNSSFLLFAALSAQESWKLFSPHIANGFLIAALLGQWIYLSYKNLKQRRFNPFLIILIYGALFLQHKFQSGAVNSLSTNLAMALFVLATLTLYFFELLDLNEAKTDLTPNRFTAIAIMSVAATAVTMKLSAIPGAAIFSIFTLFLFFRARKNIVDRIVYFIPFFILPVFLAAGYFVQVALVSGWLFYPVPAGNLHLPWSMPKDEVIAQYHAILSWARMPRHNPAIVLNNGFEFWFKPWLHHFKDSLEFQLLSFSIPLLVTLGVAGSLWARSRDIIIRYYMLPVVYTIVSLLFWFYFAPSLRFGSVYFFLLMGITLSLVMHLILLLVKRIYLSRYTYPIMLVIISLYAVIYPMKQVEHSIKNIQEIPKTYPDYPAVRNIVVDNCSRIPLSVLIPVKGNQCGAAPLPCTPYPHPLRLMKAGKLQSGFIPGIPECMETSK